MGTGRQRGTEQGEQGQLQQFTAGHGELRRREPRS
jgi:hypothetical protein